MVQSSSDGSWAVGQQEDGVRLYRFDHPEPFEIATTGRFVSWLRGSRGFVYYASSDGPGLDLFWVALSDGMPMPPRRILTGVGLESFQPTPNGRYLLVTRAPTPDLNLVDWIILDSQNDFSSRVVEPGRSDRNHAAYVVGGGKSLLLGFVSGPPDAPVSEHSIEPIGGGQRRTLAPDLRVRSLHPGAPWVAFATADRGLSLFDFTRAEPEVHHFEDAEHVVYGPGTERLIVAPDAQSAKGSNYTVRAGSQFETVWTAPDDGFALPTESLRHLIVSQPEALYSLSLNHGQSPVALELDPKDWVPAGRGQNYVALSDQSAPGTSIRIVTWPKGQPHIASAEFDVPNVQLARVVLQVF